MICVGTGIERDIVVFFIVIELQNEPQRQTIAAKKLRPPSYTDRILIHSLPDRQDRIAVQAYDFCDRLRVSDHRAVSMTIRLEVNTGVNFQNHTPIATPDAVPEVMLLSSNLPAVF